MRTFFRHLLLLVPTLIGMTLLTFLLIHLIPGDPVEVMMGERALDPEVHAAARHQLGLDAPLPIQYMRYITSLLRGDWGVSFITQTSVLEEFLQRFPATFELVCAAMCFAIGIGVPAGVLAAVKRGSGWDRGVMSAALTGYSMPIFWWGLILVMVFSVQFGLTPVSGRIALEYNIPVKTGLMVIDAFLSGEEGAVRSALSHLILPAVVLGTIPLAVIARMTRSAMLEVMREDYIRTARAKGLSPARIVFRHALRNALIPVATVIGLQVGNLLAGAILTETIFSWPGVGKWLIDAIGRRDYPVVQSGILLIAILVMALNLLVDAFQSALDPRLRG